MRDLSIVWVEDRGQVRQIVARDDLPHDDRRRREHDSCKHVGACDKRLHSLFETAVQSIPDSRHRCLFDDSALPTDMDFFIATPWFASLTKFRMRRANQEMPARTCSCQPSLEDDGIGCTSGIIAQQRGQLSHPSYDGRPSRNTDAAPRNMPTLYFGFPPRSFLAS